MSARNMFHVEAITGKRVIRGKVRIVLYQPISVGFYKRQRRFFANFHHVYSR